MNDLKAKGQKALIWDIASKVALHGNSFVVGIFLARLLDPKDFGLIAISLAFIAIFQPIIGIGLGAALIQLPKPTNKHFSTVFYTNILLAIIVTIITISLSAPASRFFEAPELSKTLMALSICFILISLHSIHIVKFRKELKFKEIAKIRFTSSLIGGGVGVVLAFSGYGVWSLVYQTIVQYIFMNIFLWKFSTWRPSLIFCTKSLNEMLGFGSRLFFSNIVNSVSNQADNMTVGSVFSIEILGYFQRAKNLNELVIKYSSESLSSVLFPTLSQIQSDTERVKLIVVNSLHLISFVIFLLIGILNLSAQTLIVVLYTEKWIDSVPILELLVLSNFYLPIYSVLSTSLLSNGKSKEYLRMTILQRSLSIFSLLLAILWGLEEYLVGLIIVSLVNTYISVFMTSKNINASKTQLMKPILQQLLIGTVSLLGASIYNSYLRFDEIVSTLLSNLVFISIYLSLNVLYKTVAIEKLKSLMK